MITLLEQALKLEEYPADKKRSAYGKLCGSVGIVLNIFLFLGKFLAGMFSNSIAITADAFNNLSDAGSSLVTLFGFKLAEQKPDSEHPFGHGRMEYLAGFVVSAIILMMGFELITDSIDKILHPSEVSFSILILVILLLSILVKCYMAAYNLKYGKQWDSAVLKAAAADSFSDCVSTAVVILATIFGRFTDMPVDAYCGIAVGFLIFAAGISAAKETLNPLLGQPAEAEFVEQIERMVLEFDKTSIIGVHDLIVHDYGPGRRIISLHAEVPAEGDMLKLHDVIDNLEMKLRKELGCLATIHMDPVVTKDARVAELKEKTNQVVKGIGEKLSIHDFRVVFGDTHINLIFDVLIPFEFAMTDSDTVKQIRSDIKKEIGCQYYAIVNVDKPSVRR